MKIHDKPFKCKLCGKCFKSRNGFNLHLGVHRRKDDQSRHQHPGPDPRQCDATGEEEIMIKEEPIDWNQTSEWIMAEPIAIKKEQLTGTQHVWKTRLRLSKN